ncbi:hypothetical protein CYLTODRAFT_494881 [Cylindrobasidium torrendii FP15055 ss-10]|uniref:Retrograde transport protein Dsl1 C-terminal domain-containing protein n=1 Tax=Cylindrobasidium torrendii FP15055 ss-10 TaxID=1314674 RepID=A0A0D7AUM7_9AGAR|nr:hypothetical protein CYLTODRAFT_494881 [Cylindrobasidium torrendii FP15055 ss-10]
MAFPLPSHLPPRPVAVPNDISSEILTKLDHVTSKTLSASLAASWIHELDETIRNTKNRITTRITDELPLFEQQEASSRSVQTRLQSLSAEVDGLVEKLSHPETGLTPVLKQTLSEHASLRDQTCQASTLYDCLDHLHRFQADLSALNTLICDGQLAQAVKVYRTMDSMLDAQPAPLSRSLIMGDLRSKFRATHTRAEDQLSDAYNRSIIVSATQLLVEPSVQVRQSTATISLHDILGALPTQALDNHLNILRRDITSLYFTRLLEQPFDLAVSNNVLSALPAQTYLPTTALDNVANVIKFLASHLFSSLPSPQVTTFPRSLRKTLGQSVLTHLVIPSLPSSFDKLPPYLDLLRQATAFEQEFILGVLACGEHTDGIITQWVEGVAVHYEKQRRQQLLDAARALICSPYPKTSNFTVEFELASEAPAVIPVQADDSVVADDAWGFEDETSREEATDDDAWGFEPETKSDGHLSHPGDAADDAWGFDDEMQGNTLNPEPRTNGHGGEEDAWGFDDDDDSDQTKVHDNGNQNGNGNGKSDGWGWDAEADAQDDAWDDDPWTESPAPKVTSPPKAAKGLLKKDKKRQNDYVSPNPSIHVEVPQKPPEKKSLTLAPPALPRKETYVVSMQMKELLSMVTSALDESSQLTVSSVFGARATPGRILSSAAPSILDLYRAMYPVASNKGLKTSLDLPIRFANNCLWLAGEVEKLLGERMQEISGAFKVLGETWFDDVVEHHRTAVDTTITEGALGFTSTGDQDRYDECEAALSKVLQDVRFLASQWQPLVAKSRYYTAIGAIVDAALVRMVEDITELPDIPEIESHRLSELCNILYALESLFIEDGDSFIAAHVPSWFKSKYLSELLEASMADIRFLFDEGMLVDFEIDELVRLVQALFADTSLRADTIARIQVGHSVSTVS